MAFQLCPVPACNPDLPVADWTDPQYRWVGTSADEGFYLQRFQNRYLFGGNWILSQSLYPLMRVGEHVLSAAERTVAGGMLYTDGARFLYPHPEGGQWIYTSAAGYTPTADLVEDEDGEWHWEGDGWHVVSVPDDYTDTGRASPQGTLLNEDDPPTLDVEIYWPRLWHNGSTFGNVGNPARKYENELDAPTFGPYCVGLPQWRKGTDTYTRTAEPIDGHYGYPPFFWNDEASAYTKGTFGERWTQGAEPSAESPWTLTEWASGAGGASAIGTTTATWNTWVQGDETAPAYCGTVAVWRGA